jgi:hypothetical protein
MVDIDTRYSRLRFPTPKSRLVGLRRLRSTVSKGSGTKGSARGRGAVASRFALANNIHHSSVLAFCSLVEVWSVILLSETPAVAVGDQDRNMTWA